MSVVGVRISFVKLNVSGMLEQAKAMGQEPVRMPVMPEGPQSRTARATRSMDDKLGALVEAMHRTIDINQQAQAAAQRTERFTRIMAWSSLGVSVASLVVAAVALFVQR